MVTNLPSARRMVRFQFSQPINGKVSLPPVPKVVSRSPGVARTQTAGDIENIKLAARNIVIFDRFSFMDVS